jgi:hypothetical protein
MVSLREGRERATLRLTRSSALSPSSETRGHSRTAISLPHPPIHVVTPVTRECEIFLAVKNDKPLIKNNSSLSKHFAILIHCSCSAGCGVSGSMDNVDKYG